MPRIPQSELDRLKHEIDLVALVRSAGVKLQRRGKDYVGLCALHADTEPSLVVTPEKGLWRCFGCGQGGSVIDWQMAIAKQGFREAVEALGAKAGEEPELVPLCDAEIEAIIVGSDEEALGLIAGHYAERLAQSERGQAYLGKRGLEGSALARHFKIGVADGSLFKRLAKRDSSIGRRLRPRLCELGVARESGKEHLAGRLVVPISDRAGSVHQLYGRWLSGTSKSKDIVCHLYLARSQDLVFNPVALELGKELIVCEAILDALTLWKAGFKNVTTAYGERGVPKALYSAIVEHGIERVIIAFDNDDNGDEAAKDFAAQVEQRGVAAWRMQLPAGMDVNDYARKVQPAKKSLDLALRKATPMSERLLVAGCGLLEGEEAQELPPSSLVASPSAASGAAGAPTTKNQEPTANPAASVLPAIPTAQITAQTTDHESTITIEDRRYRVRGMAKNLSYDVLKVNLLAARGDGFHIDSLDLYSAKQRAAFIKQAALELSLEQRLVKRDLGKVLLELETLQDEQIKKTLEPKDTRPTMSQDEREAAYALLENPHLLDIVLEDFEACGVVGEQTNKLVAYLAGVSRLLEAPLAVLVQSSSAAGKSALMNAALAFVPEEERVQYSAMTGQSLYYMGEKDLQHKVLAIAEEEGAERASYALKLLQSEGELSIASTGKDPATGKLTTHEYHVEGPVAILCTTTAIDVDEELLNRCLVLTVDESREQTRAIHKLQREGYTRDGVNRKRRRSTLMKRQQNAQRLLEPLEVIIAQAPQLRFPESCLRSRRDHMKYLGLIATVALLHQFQRRRGAVESGGELRPAVLAELADIAIANRIACEVLGRTLDELPPQTRRLLVLLHGFVAEECSATGIDQPDFRFGRRWLRGRCGWGDTQLKIHLARLVDMEYLGLHSNGHAQRHIYELFYDGGGLDGKPFLPGLIDVSELSVVGSRLSESDPSSDPTTDYRQPTTDQNRSGQNPNRSAPGRPPVGGWSGGGRNGESQSVAGLTTDLESLAPKTAHRGSQKEEPSTVKSR
jgi:DNA primase catalytic core